MTNSRESFTLHTIRNTCKSIAFKIHDSLRHEAMVTMLLTGNIFREAILIHVERGYQ